MDFNLICAVSLNGVIGDSLTNTIPWYLPSDLKSFKAITTGSTVVMGSNTYNSLGRNLPNRRNVVISRGATQLCAIPHEIYRSFAEAQRGEITGFFVIGGQHIYRDALLYGPNKLYITIVKMDAQGDVRFPISGKRFEQDVVHTTSGFVYNCINRSEVLEENGLQYQFTVFQRS